MAWLLSILLSLAPWLWVVPAAGAAGLWIYGWVAPATGWYSQFKIAAEVVRIAALALVGVSVYLWCWSTATEACMARVAEATRSEEARQKAIVGDALTQARAEGAAATAAAEKARTDLEAEIDRLDHEPDPPQAPKCGLSRRWTEILP